MVYNWQQKNWPAFTYSLHGMEGLLQDFARETAHIGGMLAAMPQNIQADAILDTMVSEAIKTFEIEGEHLSRPDVVSSIRNNMGLNRNPDPIKDKKAQGAGELMVAIRNTYHQPLTEPMLLSWHTMLMRSNEGINVGMWRQHVAPMQVVSGAIGREKVHFEAPPSAQVPNEMKAFIEWFNDTAPGGRGEIKEAPVRSAIAHLYFESIHPFEDGNGRIGRAIAEKVLSQTVGRPILLSLSQTIEADRKTYYSALQQASCSNEITEWITYFVDIVLKAQEQAKQLIEFTLLKARFFAQHEDNLNERQLKAIHKMFAAGADGFEGGMTAQKYISITKASKATATRDLQTLADIGALKMHGAGRSTRYLLVL